MRYRKQPIEVEAWHYVGVDATQITPEHPENVTAQMLADSYVTYVYIEPTSHWGGACNEDECKSNHDLLLWVEKSHNHATISPGDWIIAERDGVGFYPCTRDQFAQTYERAELQAIRERVDSELLRGTLEALCQRDGLGLESLADPGTPARNYELALRLGIGHVFGLPND